MSAKSLLRAGLSSPRSLRSPSTPKSILKRPPPLALSQNPFKASVTIVLSPGSPHVHFPPSPGLTATYTTHSPNTYDRGAIVVSPNPLELPSWGSRIYSPSSETFGKPASTESSPAEELTPTFKTFTPPILSLSSPNFDEVFPKSPVADTKPTTRASARFQAIAAQPTIRPVSALGEALKSYPRSPYPSAPASPAPAVLAEQENAEIEDEERLAGRVWSRTKTVYGTTPSLVSREAGAKAKAKKVPPAITIIGRSAEMVSSPLRQEFLTPVEESPQHTATAANTSSKSHAQLTQAFWQSMSLDESMDDVGSPRITNEDPVASGLLSPGGMISPMIFATKEGVVWSPPRRDVLFHKKDLKDTVFSSGGSRAMVMSPSPEDPFSAFPSFSAVLSLDHGKEESIITYPPPAVTVETA
ncbi:hypothetical protein F5878DRAFT_625634 [Lentinula raphanica]|uniref:Uncharacterized protein n=1 Tax=Lentinula raphanica TaxID=153919 RepID=A0AA38P4W3_9AGAR|nr:hypothetical protein F5880DRAFT_1541329 [Lentinula raphanica]KAJ3836246.1 hypothetical protein F5878DRAFT_625634 [Lentinula raphanica]